MEAPSTSTHKEIESPESGESSECVEETNRRGKDEQKSKIKKKK